MADDRDESPSLHTDRESRTKLAVARNHPDEAYRLRCGHSGDTSENCDALWHVDAIALSMSWRPDGLPITDDEKVTITRLVVLRALEDARRAEARRRGRRETILNLRRGDPLVGGKKLPDILDRAWIGGIPPSPKVANMAEMTAERLGVELQGDAGDGARLRAAVEGKQHQGRPPSIELPAFVRSLALFWWRNTGRRPEREINPIRQSKKRIATFVDLVIAASTDVSRTGRFEPEGIRSVIRRELERMEKSGQKPWKTT